VVYLAIFLAAACTGIAALWLHQRRQRMHLRSVDGFRSSLERISTHEIANVGLRTVRKTVSSPGATRRPEPLDPARRAAAKRSIERRRAARA
jgi:hypothetical protein